MVAGLVADLRLIGLAEGDAVALRCATRPIAPNVKGAAGMLLDALLQTVGPNGTVIASTHTEVQKSREKAPRAVFSSDTPTTAGGFAAAVLRHPNRRRSAHASNSIAAIGAHADFIVGAHGERSRAFSWVRQLIEVSGKQMVIGCVADSPGFNTVHFAQEELGLSNRTFLSGSEGSFVAVPDGEPRWVPRIHVPGCSLGFWKMYSPYIRGGILRAGLTGEAYSIFSDAGEAFDLDRMMLARNPRAVLCDRPDCLSCASWSYARRRLPALAISTFVKKANVVAGSEILGRRWASPRSGA